jgi:hypothetical protein
MSKHPLGEYSKCEWCKEEHKVYPDNKTGVASGWNIANEAFSIDGGEGLIGWKTEGYLCDNCAEIANAAPLLLIACKMALADIDFLLRDGYDMTLAECGIEGVKDTIRDLASLIIRLDPNGETFVRETDQDLAEQEDNQ